MDEPKPKKHRPTPAHAIERKYPELVASYVIHKAEHPKETVAQAAQAVGMPVYTARELQKRIDARYAELRTVLEPISKDLLERRLSHRLDIIDAFLTPDKLAEKLEKATLAQIGVYEGIMHDKLMALRGQPTAILSVQDQTKLDQILPALVKAIQQRGLHAKLTERTAEFQTGTPALDQPTLDIAVSQESDISNDGPAPAEPETD